MVEIQEIPDTHETLHDMVCPMVEEFERILSGGRLLTSENLENIRIASHDVVKGVRRVTARGKGESNSLMVLLDRFTFSDPFLKDMQELAMFKHNIYVLSISGETINWGPIQHRIVIETFTQSVINIFHTIGLMVYPRHIPMGYYPEKDFSIPVPGNNYVVSTNGILLANFYSGSTVDPYISRYAIHQSSIPRGTVSIEEIKDRGIAYKVYKGDNWQWVIDTIKSMNEALLHITRGREI